MIKRPDTNAQRIKRHKRVRAKISGTPERPRLNVFRSEKNIYAQIIDDVAGNTLVAASSLDKEIEGNGGNKAAARAVGKLVAERAKAKGIDVVVFDHGLKRLLNDGRRRCGHLRDGRRGRRVGRAHAGGQNEQQRGEKRHVHTEAGMFERQERVHRRCGVRVTGRQTIRNQVCSGTRRCRAERGRGRFHRAITVNTPLGSCRQVIKESI